MISWKIFSSFSPRQQFWLSTELGRGIASITGLTQGDAGDRENHSQLYFFHTFFDFLNCISFTIIFAFLPLKSHISLEVEKDCLNKQADTARAPKSTKVVSQQPQGGYNSFLIWICPKCIFTVHCPKEYFPKCIF